ncbi:hypothetical protein [Sphingomonas sp.]|jgi:hypothetical protein|uniref:hypothetical protein n=1 Tax=Sphingomonas sp. TaxID=28214 RepID=UPI002ED96517
MRLISATLAVCVLAAPAMAQSRADREAVRQLNNPVVQEGAVAMLGALAGIVLDTRVGPIARYADPGEGIRPDDTLRSLVRREDPRFEARLREDARRAVAVVGITANDALTMSDEITRTASRLRAALAPLRPLTARDDEDY